MHIKMASEVTWRVEVKLQVGKKTALLVTASILRKTPSV